jgi:hypothetical protein
MSHPDFNLMQHGTPTMTLANSKFVKVSNSPNIWERIIRWNILVTVGKYYPTRLLEAAQGYLGTSTQMTTGTWNAVPGYPGTSQLVNVSAGVYLNGLTMYNYTSVLIKLNALKDFAGVPIFDPPLVDGVDTWEDVKTRIAQFFISETSYPDALSNQDFVLFVKDDCREG